jgi:hypothetical protein
VDPNSPTEIAAVASFVSLGGSFALSRLRGLRWRGGLVRAAKAQEE